MYRPRGKSESVFTLQEITCRPITQKKLNVGTSLDMFLQKIISLDYKNSSCFFTKSVSPK